MWEIGIYPEVTTIRLGLFLNYGGITIQWTSNKPGDTEQ